MSGYQFIRWYPSPLNPQRPGSRLRDALDRPALVRLLKHDDRFKRRLQRLQAVAVACPGLREGVAGAVMSNRIALFVPLLFSTLIIDPSWRLKSDDT